MPPRGVGLLHFKPFWASPAGVWEASGGPLGRRWALLARLLALLRLFWVVSGVVLGAIGQEA